MDLDDAECEGLTFKRRLVQLKDGTCYLMARWKPDRYMRRAAAGKSQKWFLDKEVFPKDAQELFARHGVGLDGGAAPPSARPAPRGRTPAWRGAGRRSTGRSASDTALPCPRHGIAT